MTPQDVQHLNFAQLVGVVDEPNTPSGGTHTIKLVLQHRGRAKHDRILDVGCNTGFATVRLALGCGASLVGTDILLPSLRLARAAANAAGVTAPFVCADAVRMPFRDETFSLVYVNNVTSFIADRAAAIREYYRVLAPGGRIAVVPIYYRQPPPLDLLREVEGAIGTSIPVTGKAYWYDAFAAPQSRIVFDRDFGYVDQSAESIVCYAARVMNRPHLDCYGAEVRQALSRRLVYFYDLFNRNLRYAAFSVIIYAKNAAAEHDLAAILHPLADDTILFQSIPLQ